MRHHFSSIPLLLLMLLLAGVSYASPITTDRLTAENKVFAESSTENGILVTSNTSSLVFIDRRYEWYGDGSYTGRHTWIPDGNLEDLISPVLADVVSIGDSFTLLLPQYSQYVSESTTVAGAAGRDSNMETSVRTITTSEPSPLVLFGLGCVGLVVASRRTPVRRV